MRVLYDYSAFDMQTHGGVSRCFVELYRCLPEKVKAEISVKVTDNVYLQQLGFKSAQGLYDHFMTPRNFLGKKFLFKLYYNFYYHEYSRWDRKPRHNFG